ncbi:hypothetical protein D3C86_1794450 [compost metagenome]
MESRKNPKIIHYGGTIKPWQRADADFADSYWHIAKRSVYYELILSRMAVWAANNTPKHRSAEKIRIRSRVVRKLRRTADRVAPSGTILRKPLTLASQAIRKIVR